MRECRLHYDLPEMEDLNDGYGGYATVRAWDDGGHEVSVTTNRAGNGLFRKEQGPSGYSIRQVSGTMQFSLPRSKSGVRKMPAREYDLRKAEGFWD